MQGVIKSYDPGTGDGVVLCDTDLREYDLAPDALQGSVFRMLRQRQRVIFDVDAATRATRLRLGSAVDMATLGFGGVPYVPTQSLSSAPPETKIHTSERRREGEERARTCEY